MQKLLKELELKRFNLMMIHINNQKIISLIKNSEFHICMKHIDIHHHYIKKVKLISCIQLNYVSMNDMMTDRLTKSFLVVKFIHFINLIDFIVTEMT